MFAAVVGPAGAPGYRVRVCAETPDVALGPFDVRVRDGLDALAAADTVIVPGVPDLDAAPPPAVLEALRAAARREARVASMCSGAFVLAAAGLLDGRRATTHRHVAAALAARYPAVRVDVHAPLVEDGVVLTSAAGLDLCLHLVRRDYGAAAAAAAARRAVLPLAGEDNGSWAVGTASSASPAAGAGAANGRPAGPPLGALLAWVDAHLDRPPTLAAMARQAALSPRTLARRFRAQAQDPRRPRRTRAIADRKPAAAEALAADLRALADGSGAPVRGVPLDPAAVDGDVVILATWYASNLEVASRMRDRLAGKVVVDISNPLDETFDGLATRRASRYVPNAKWLTRRACRAPLGRGATADGPVGQPEDWPW